MQALINLKDEEAVYQERKNEVKKYTHELLETTDTRSSFRRLGGMGELLLDFECLQKIEINHINFMGFVERKSVVGVPQNILVVY